MHIQQTLLSHGDFCKLGLDITQCPLMENNPTEDLDTTLTNLIKPTTAATLTIRVIKSFTFRTERSLVLHDVNLEKTSVGQLKERVREGMHTHSGTDSRLVLSLSVSVLD